jgi:DNA-binding Lrp family transcriptional regulator
MKLDPTDRAILVALQDDAKLTNAELAERIHLSASACLRRTRMLEESGLIARTVALLDPRLAGLPGTAYVFVTLDSQGRAALDRFEAAVRLVPDLERIHTEILTPLPGVVRVQSTLTLRAVKRTTKLPI